MKIALAQMKMDTDIEKLQSSIVAIASELYRFQRVFEKAVSKLEMDEHRTAV